MKYILNRNHFKLNEGWLEEKIKPIESNIIKAILTNWVKPFSKWMDTIKDKWTSIKGVDIAYQFLANLNKSIEFLTIELQKTTNPKDLEDIIDNLTSTNSLLKDEFIKKLMSDIAENANLNGYIAAIKDMFDIIEENIENLTEQYSGIDKIENLEAKKKEAIKIFKDMFKNIEEAINNKDYEKIIEENKENAEAFKVGDAVSYKKEEFDESKPVNDQPENIGKGIVKSIDNENVVIENRDLGKDITKNISDIIIQKVDKSKKIQDLKTDLGKIKDDPKKLAKVMDFVKTLVE